MSDYTMDEFFADLEKDEVIGSDVRNAGKIRKIVDAIVSARIRLGLSQKELARRCNMKQSAVARFERLQNIPNLGTVLKIAERVGLDIRIEETEPVRTEVLSISACRQNSSEKYTLYSEPNNQYEYTPNPCLA